MFTHRGEAELRTTCSTKQESTKVEKNGKFRKTRSSNKASFKSKASQDNKMWN